MPRNTHFQFKQFGIVQAQSGMKVTTDGCLFGAWVANEIAENDPEKILDIGTGTGLLTLMLAQKTNAEFDAVELELSAYEEALANFKQSPWNDRISCHHCRVQDFNTRHKYNVIICNPPFFSQNLKGTKPSKNKAIHNDDLNQAELVHSISILLSDTGSAFILYPEQEMTRFEEAADEVGLYLNNRCAVKDTRRSSVLRVMGNFSHKVSPATTSELVIKEDDGQYSPDFIDLLAPYYLHL